MTDYTEVRIPEDQMQRLENMVSKVEGAVKNGPSKTIRGRLTDFFLGRFFMVVCFAGYMMISNGMSIPNFSKVQRQVLNYDKKSNILTLDNRGKIENFIFSDGKMFDNDEEVSDNFLTQVKRAIVLGEDFPVQKGWW